MAPATALVLFSYLLQESQPSTGPEIGRVAPALRFDEVLGVADTAAFVASLRGKVVVLEFSTSWCAGCRASVPHWNRLIAELAGEPVAFVTVTNESGALAERMVAETGLRSTLAIDLTGALFEAFGVGGVPDVVIVGGDGKIAGFSHPQELEAAALRRLLAGERPSFAGGKERARRDWNHARALADSDPDPGTFMLRACEKPSGIVTTDDKKGILRANGLAARSLFALVLGCEAGDVELDASLAAAACFDLRARAKTESIADTRALALQRLCAELQVEVVTERVRAKALVLSRSATESRPSPADAAHPGGVVRPGKVRLGSTTSARLASVLRLFCSQPVVDETGLAEPFAIDLEWTGERDLEGLRAALGKAGLKLEAGERELPHHEVRPRTR